MRAIDVAKRLYEGKIPSNDMREDRPFQANATAKLVKKKKHVLGLPMGVGKTLIAVDALAEWKPKRSLIIPTERAVLSWLKAMWQFHPSMLEDYIILGKMYNKDTRAQFWAQQGKRPQLHIITNYQTLTRDKESLPTNWDSVAFDEYHKFMRNRDTQLHKIAKSFKSEYLTLVSGSPSSKGAIDFFIPFNLIDPKLFSSYWRFAETWCEIIEDGFGKTVQGFRNENAFRRLLNDYAIIATKKDLGLQKKQREIIKINMTPTQASAYEALRDDFLLELEGQAPIVALNTLANYTKLRQLLACPAILSPSLGAGGSAEYIKETLLDLNVNERHCVVFTPYRGALPYLKAYFEGIGDAFGLPDPGTSLEVPVFTFSGGMGMEKLFEQLHEWKQTGGIAICTVDFAESFDMETADKAFFAGYSWDPQVNFQAEDRLDRLTNKHGLINVYYLENEGTLDSDVLYALTIKQTNVNKVYSDRRNIIQLLTTKR